MPGPLRLFGRVPAVHAQSSKPCAVSHGASYGNDGSWPWRGVRSSRWLLHLGDEAYEAAFGALMPVRSPGRQGFGRRTPDGASSTRPERTPFDPRPWPISANGPSASPAHRTPRPTVLFTIAPFGEDREASTAWCTSEARIATIDPWQAVACSWSGSVNVGPRRRRPSSARTRPDGHRRVIWRATREARAGTRPRRPRDSGRGSPSSGRSATERWGRQAPLGARVGKGSRSRAGRSSRPCHGCGPDRRGSPRREPDHRGARGER